MHALSFHTPRSGAPGEIFGIDVAIRNFARNYCRYTRQEKIYVVPNHPESYQVFLGLAAEAGIDPTRCTSIQGPSAHLIEQVHTLFHPDPQANSFFWHRNSIVMGGGTGYAVSTLTHTMTGSDSCNVVADYLTNPTQPGDAIICPSRAIKAAIAKLWDLNSDYLNHRFRLAGDNKFTCPVDLPVIPLAIETERFIERTAPDKRQAQRAALGIADDEVVILWFGRMSYYTKAHPLPTLMAVERAAQRTQTKLRLVMMGFFSPPELEAEYRGLVADICQHVTVDFISKDDPRFPDGLWAAADIFTSLVDNHQESFGLTPIEGMAAGLPCVVTDWDGYRDGVRHGIDGFLVPTASPGNWMGYDIAYHYYNNALAYSEYLATAAQSVAVDIDVAAAAFALLADNADKRRQMGASARRRAQETFDWSRVIPQYEALWDEQYEKRKSFAAAPTPYAWPAVHRAFPDPYTMFESFPSAIFSDDQQLVLTGGADQLEVLLKHKMNYFRPIFLLPLPEMVAFMTWLAQNPGSTIGAYRALLRPDQPPNHYTRTVGWLMKNGLIAFATPLAPKDHQAA